MRKILLCFVLSITPLFADDDQFRERFADPATRGAALAELIPGTQSGYFRSALGHQLAGRAASIPPPSSASPFWSATPRKER